VDFSSTERSQDLQRRVGSFLRERVLPAERIYREQLDALPSPHHEPRVIAELKHEARAAGLWNLFMPDPAWGPGLSNTEYAPLAELMGRSLIAPEVFNCNAPDTGNMEVLSMFGTPEQQERWLRPLLAGEIRSCFLMTEPTVASSDATNMSATIRRDGDEYVLNGRKWWITNGPRPHCAIGIFMGISDPTGPQHRRHSMMLVELDRPGIRIERTLSVFGYDEGDGHAEILFEDVRVPASNLLQEEGDGFRIAQGRLGPGRIHHCMRAVGQSERALELMIHRAAHRQTFGAALIDRDLIRSYIAESRIDIDQSRLLTLHAAWLIDQVGAKAARKEISMIKVAVPRATLRVIDRAMQTFGAAGLSQDTPLAHHYAHARTLRIVDGPDEVHILTVARLEIAQHMADDA
jgi:acyl-CoA dehydrogenase